MTDVKELIREARERAVRLGARASTKAVAERGLEGTPDAVVLSIEIDDLTAAARLIESLSLALEQAIAGAEWRPIETAPKDGREILIWKDGWDFAPKARWIERDCEDGFFNGWAFDSGYISGACEDCFVGWSEDIESGVMPTHWRPLPSPPEPSP